MRYEEFRKNITDKIEERLEWRDLATFIPNKRLPVYNWFYYKEGFAKELVENLLTMFEIKEGSIVLDPFCGSGTTLLTCKQNGVDAIGFDVLPVSVFTSKVKTADYSEEMIEKLRISGRKITGARFMPTYHEFPPIVKRAFSKYALQDIAFLRARIMELDPDVREFFVMALMSTALKCTYAYKDGSFIKFRQRPVPPLRKMFRRVASKMVKDIEKSRSSANVTVDFNDARRLPLDDASIDAVITSPPYLNNIDYTKVYAIEEFFVHGEAMPGIRAYIGLAAKDSEFLAEVHMPLQARLYFEDMFDVLSEIYRVLKEGGHAALVVGNGYVNDVIESDIILAYLADKIGFSVDRIYVLNKRFALEDRTTKKGVLRESLLILKKS